MHVVATMVAGLNDVVETHTNHSASITFKDNTLTLLGNSRIRVRENAADLLSGGVSVTSKGRYAIQSDCLTVVPVPQEARYSVVPYQNRIYIDAEQSNVSVKSNKSKREMSVPQGKTLAVTNACKPGELMDFAGQNDTWYKAAIGAAGPAGVTTVCSLPKGSKQDMSAEKRTCW